jgi:L-cysteine S-thiosulfotransferase
MIDTLSAHCREGGNPGPPRQHWAPAFAGASGWMMMAFALSMGLPAQAQDPALRPYEIAGDAIPQSLTGAPGDAARGQRIVASRQQGLCLLCHSGPFPEERFQGDLSPSLNGAGARWSEGQLRLRIVDGSKVNPDTIMPSYYRIEGFNRVSQNFRGKPILTAEQVEDVVAFLATLKD